MRNINQTTHCSNCGAPATTEICPYCHVSTGIDTKNADMEYPVIDCKEANLGFFNVLFPLIFTVAFGFAGYMSTALTKTLNQWTAGNHFNIGIIFTVISVIAFVIAAIPVTRFLLISMAGKEIEATVYGYMDDNIFINGSPAQIVKLLVNTNDGKKFILYQLGDIKQPFKINSTIKLNVYKNLFMIKNKKQYYF